MLCPQGPFINSLDAILPPWKNKRWCWVEVSLVGNQLPSDTGPAHTLYATTKGRVQFRTLEDFTVGSGYSNIVTSQALESRRVLGGSGDKYIEKNSTRWRYCSMVLVHWNIPGASALIALSLGEWTSKDYREVLSACVLMLQ